MDNICKCKNKTKISKQTKHIQTQARKFLEESRKSSEFSHKSTPKAYSLKEKKKISLKLTASTLQKEWKHKPHTKKKKKKLFAQHI